MKIFKRIREYAEYRKHVKAMKCIIERQNEIQPGPDGNLTDDGKKLFNFYALSYCLHAAEALKYQAKHTR